MTFGPSRRSTLAEKPPPLTLTGSPRTITRALAGTTRPLTCTLASRVVDPSAGAVSASWTGGRGRGAGSSPQPATVATSTAVRSRSARDTMRPA